jgi:diguanylate cyclase (GGDEF)-like protein/PAS domain S-box-containing protein
MQLAHGRLSRQIAIVVLVAVAYYATGRLGLLLAIPPGYATAVWPASGIALASVLLLGPRAGIGIWLGSFAINVWTQLDLSDVQATALSLTVPAVIASGAAVQALAGAALIQRYGGNHNILEQELETIRLLTLGGPVACLIAASIGVGGLWATGAVATDTVLFNWWTWWVGDSIGVLIFTPVILIWSVRPIERWYRQQLATTVPLFVLFALVVVVFFVASAREQDRLEADFEAVGNQATEHLRTELDGFEVALAAVAGLFLGEDEVSAKQFDDFADLMLERLPEIFAISWNVSVPAANRAEFEARMRARGHENFRIVEPDGNGQLVPAGVREQHVVVAFIRYADEVPGAHGLDIAFDPVRTDALRVALQTGRSAATEPIALIGDREAAEGLLLTLPVRDGGGELRGFATLVIRHRNLFEHVGLSLATRGIEIDVFDRTAPAERQRIFGADSARNDTDLRHSTHIDIGQRRWELAFVLPSAYLLAHRPWQTWIVLAGGLLLAALLGILILVLMGRNAKVEARVTRRTLELKASEERFRGLVESAPDATVIVDSDLRIGLVNSQAEKMFGCSRAELIGQSMQRLIPNWPEIASRFLGAALGAPDMNDGAIGAHGLHARRRDGSSFPVEITGGPLSIDGQTTLIIAIRDISARVQAEARIQHLAHHDTLTGLPNRALLQDRMTMAMAAAERSGRSMAVLMLDLDHFKRINDSLGHEVGDQLLVVIAERLRNCVRKSDTVARMGGDEFVILLTEVDDRDGIEKIADTIVRQVSLPMTLGKHELVVSPSIGLCMFPEDGRDGLSLLKSADTAMYQAKSHGRSHYQWFDHDMLRAPEEHLVLTNAMHRALERGEFSLLYQPVVDLHSLRIVAVEALLRWEHPTRGALPPSSFVHLAEESGMIAQIGEWVLRTASADVRRLEQNLGEPLGLAVNISPRQIRQRSIVQMVERALLDSGMPPERLTLEITESLLLERGEDTIETLEQLRRIGVSLAVDDFGTGYSSLSYLTRFPIDKLKIDGSFVRDLNEDAGDAAVVSAIIALAKSLSMIVIAEGVETLHQLRYLRDRGCDEVQGFYLARPVQLDEVPALVQSLRAMSASGFYGVAARETGGAAEAGRANAPLGGVTQA